ncbi:protein of unassigned function [Methylobacterium oryzae CBMB20]|uniref:Protein of unassigned function n=1 Tax=Methylobacterium oryzae CBMB20 TaxID=693986 RepID=A0A089NT76_9HYPH|nr:protein of unassigned function [Methylobacterium oryzae CBMB20]
MLCRLAHTKSRFRKVRDLSRVQGSALLTAEAASVGASPRHPTKGRDALWEPQRIPA